MEIHLKANYDEFKRLKCNKCTKEFLLEWQLRRHMENHEKQNGRKCNYTMIIRLAHMKKLDVYCILCMNSKNC